MPAFGYNTLLDVRLTSVDLDFCLFLTVPTTIGFLLAIVLLWLYPWHGNYSQEIKQTLPQKREMAGK